MAFLRLAPNPWVLAAGVVLDLLLGDPNYRAHPVRLIGWTLTRTENALRKSGFDGYGGGIALFFVLAFVWDHFFLKLHLRNHILNQCCPIIS